MRSAVATHVGVDPGELLLAPGVGLLEVDAWRRGTGGRRAGSARGPRHPPRGRGRAGGCAGRRRGAGRPWPPPRRRARRSARTASSSGAPSAPRPGEEGGEEAVRRGEVVALGDALDDLPPGRHEPAVGGLAQRRGPLLEGRGHPGEPGGDGGPVVLGRGRHQVEDVAAALQRRGDDVELHPVVAGLVRSRRSSPSRSRIAATVTRSTVVDGLDGVEAGQGVAGESARGGRSRRATGRRARSRRRARRGRSPRSGWPPPRRRSGRRRRRRRRWAGGSWKSVRSPAGRYPRAAAAGAAGIPADLVGRVARGEMRARADIASAACSPW